MPDIMSNSELRRAAAKLIVLRIESRAGAWPRFDRDIKLVDKEGPDGSLLFACYMDESKANPLGIVHGGVTASLLDTCMGVTCIAQYDKALTPTITMTVNYARPVPLNSDVRVRSHTVRLGNSSAQMSAEVFLPERPDEILASATGVYAVRRGN